MARQERRKEDLIADGVAMVNRGEFRSPVLVEPLIAGFRENGALSLFFGEDPVFHFNARGEFRRAYVSGQLFKAENGALVRMQRQRTASEHQLVSSHLSTAESARFLTELNARLVAIERSCVDGSLEMIREVASGSRHVRELLHEWLVRCAGELRVADSPHV